MDRIDKADDNDEEETQQDYPSDWEPEWSTDTLPPYIGFGVVPTTGIHASQDKVPNTGRILTFPNWIQVGLSLSLSFH